LDARVPSLGLPNLPTWGFPCWPSVTKRILIADDHESVLRGLRASLGANPGWEICGDATDGKEAIARAAELCPDLIVMDFAMPRLDGLRAAQEIRKLLRSVPIVMNTLYGSAEGRGPDAVPQTWDRFSSIHGFGANFLIRIGFERCPNCSQLPTHGHRQSRFASAWGFDSTKPT